MMRLERAPIGGQGATRFRCTCGHIEDVVDLASLAHRIGEDPALPEGIEELPDVAVSEPFTGAL